MGDIVKLLNIVESEFEEIVKGTIGPDTVIESVLPLNSMNSAILLTCIELDYDVTLTFNGLKNCVTFRDLSDLIHSMIKTDA